MATLDDLYVTRTELKTYMSIEVDTYDAILDDVIASAQTEVNNHCYRQFNRTDVATARDFTAVRPGLVITDDFYTTDSLVLATDDQDDGTFSQIWTPADYSLLPANGVELGQTGRPFWRIVATNRNGLKFPGGRDYPMVRLTAKWGWAAVPNPVKQATKIQAADSFQYKDTRMGVAGMDQFGTVLRIRDNGVAATKLRPFRRGKVRSL